MHCLYIERSEINALAKIYLKNKMALAKIYLKNKMALAKIYLKNVLASVLKRKGTGIKTEFLSLSKSKA
jgi:hypothetical protein